MFPSANDLKYFKEVCYTLNLSRAAERLAISQPSLSQAIKRLENEIGTELLIRTKHGVLLTKAGEDLAKNLQNLLNLWQDIKSRSLDSLQIAQGPVSLGCHTAIASYNLPKLLPPLLRDHPQLEINCNHDISRKILESIINFRIDVGIVVNPTEHPDLILHQLYCDKVKLWSSKPLDSKDKTLHLICDTDLTQVQTIIRKLESTGYTIRLATTTSDFNLISNLTLQGIGIGILPETIAQTQKQLIPLDDLPYYEDIISLAYRPEMKHLKTMQTLTQYIKQYCASQN